MASQSVPVGTISAHASFGGNYPLTTIPSGYTCIGMVTFDCGDPRISFSRAGANSEILYFSSYNNSNGTITNVSVTMKLLCVKQFL